MVLQAGGGVGARELDSVSLAVDTERVLVLLHRQRRIEGVPVAQRPELPLHRQGQ